VTSLLTAIRSSAELFSAKSCETCAAKVSLSGNRVGAQQSI
jgi:hypothetical protein